MLARVGIAATSVQPLPSKTSVSGTSFPLAWPPTTMILSPTTAAAAAARGWLSLGSSCHAALSAYTRSDCPEVSSAPGTKPPITTASPL